MDLHVIIVIACVFLASLFSILLINKFFKSKTYEEAAAEKKALVEKLYPSSAKTNKKLPRKLSTKKEAKKEKKRQQQQRETTATENDSYDSDNMSMDSQSVESSPAHSLTKKLHVEFTEPETIELSENRRTSDTKIVGSVTIATTNGTGKQQKRKTTSNSKHNSGILLNKSEQILVKDQLTAEPLNHFENKPPKDFIELKKQHQDSVSAETKVNLKNAQNINQKKSNKAQQKHNNISAELINGMVITKEMKQVDEKQISSKSSTESPKNYSTSNKSKHNNNNAKKKDQELSTLLDKLTSGSPTEVIGVNCLMTLFSRAELNRSDIQILIDYLLNKQQDSVIVTHSEWSDDIVQKLRKQLNEKEKALQEEQEASVGLQGKLRDLRTEINMERAQFNVNNKAYMEDIYSKSSEIQNLNQELQNLNEILQIERQKQQSILTLEKQLMNKIQQLTDCNISLENELNQNQNLVSELQLEISASRQLVEDHYKLKQKLSMLEKHITEIEELQVEERELHKLEMAKLVENKKELNKVDILNLQNALDSTKGELILTNNELNELETKFAMINNKCQEQNKTTADLQKSLTDYKEIVNKKDAVITDMEYRIRQSLIQEDELMKLINEQKEKNNDLRTKNWKLIDALKNAETTANNKIPTDTSNGKNLNNLVTCDAVATATPPTNVTIESDPKIQQQKMRELLQRLFPNEIKSINDLSIDEFVDYINATEKTRVSLTLPFTKLNNEHYNLNNNTSHNHNNVNSINNSITNNTSNTSNDNNLNNSSSSSSNNNIDTRTLLLQNSQLRTRTDELTKIVTKTENMLTSLENQAREQDAYWQNIVQTQQEEINLLKSTNANGEAI